MEMNTAELKIDIINKITNLKEVRIVEEIQKILDFELDQGVFQLSEPQNKRIIEAAQDDYLTDEQANKDIDECLKNIKLKFKNNIDIHLISIDEIYQKYCEFSKTLKKYIVSKRYFEKYFYFKFHEYIVHDKFIDIVWLDTY